MLRFRASAFASLYKFCGFGRPSRRRPGVGAFVRGLPSILISLLVPFPSAYFFGTGRTEVVTGGSRISKLAIIVVTVFSAFAIVA